MKNSRVEDVVPSDLWQGCREEGEGDPHRYRCNCRDQDGKEQVGPRKNEDGEKEQDQRRRQWSYCANVVGDLIKQTNFANQAGGVARIDWQRCRL